MRRLRRSGRPTRRDDPPGPAGWWDPDDQAWAEGRLLGPADLGRGWRPQAMINNAGLLDPYGDGPAADAIRAERARRRLTALVDGRAWRRREGEVLAVLRTEVFAVDDGDGRHRSAWREHGRRCLEDTWRTRWRDREVEAGWIEARWVADDDRPVAALGAADDAVDWCRVEDHTGAGQDVAVYEHATVWRGRRLLTLTVRHDLGLDLDLTVADACRLVHARLGGDDR